jgi:hypothetical protein
MAKGGSYGRTLEQIIDLMATPRESLLRGRRHRRAAQTGA